MSNKFHVRKFFDAIPDADVLVIEKEPSTEMHTNAAYFFTDRDELCHDPMGIFEFRFRSKTWDVLYEATRDVKPGTYHRKDFLRRYETWVPYDSKQILRKIDEIKKL